MIFFFCKFIFLDLKLYNWYVGNIFYSLLSKLSKGSFYVFYFENLLTDTFMHKNDAFFDFLSDMASFDWGDSETLSIFMLR